MKSLLLLQAMHQLKDEIGLVTLAPDVAERVRVELGWVDGVDFRLRQEPIKRDVLFVNTRKTA